MKNINKYVTLFLFLLSIVLGIMIYFLVKSHKSEKPIIIVKPIYKEHLANDSLKRANDSLTVLANAKKKIYYQFLPKYILKDTAIHDTIYQLITLGEDIIKLQDSIIANKDSIIFNLKKDNQLLTDTAYYFQELYTNEKKKVKRYKRIAIVSIILNGIQAVK